MVAANLIAVVLCWQARRETGKHQSRTESHLARAAVLQTASAEFNPPSVHVPRWRRLVDAHRSERCVHKDVQVRLLSSVLLRSWRIW